MLRNSHGNPPAPHQHGSLGRRAVLLGGLTAAAGLLAACAPESPAASPSPTPTRTPRPSPTPTPTPSPTPLPPLEDTPHYAVLDGEVEPECKQAAVDFVTAVLSTGTVATVGTTLEDRLATIGQPFEVAVPMLDLLPPTGASTLEIVYPQYGGLSDNRSAASVMLNADHLVRPAESGTPVIERRSMTVDLRMRRENGAWIVAEVLPAVLPSAAPSLSPSALAVLENDRVLMADAARADISGGEVRDQLLDALTAFSERWSVGVQVFSAGHPFHVWATQRPSWHSSGRAVDIWALDGIPIIDRVNSEWSELMTTARRLGATEVGGPANPPIGGTFANATHQDHVHVAFPNAA